MTENIRLTYRGVEVPTDRYGLYWTDNDNGEAFRAGIDAVLGTTPEEPTRRIAIDDGGEEWHELEPGKFWYRNGSASAETRRQSENDGENAYVRSHTEEELRASWGIKEIRNA